ncbi:MAG TPA: hypothetical protein VFW12_08280 [Candidatus Limnocylindria bacterium]|nr:hypothetical protein [Candidatus Limnocylindria bacterium]
MKPGATASPLASISIGARSPIRPTSATFPPAIARSVRRGGPPVPS